MKTRVLIVDDHALFRDGLKAMINRETDMEVVGDAENGQNAVKLARELQPDVILMDVKKPSLDDQPPDRAQDRIQTEERLVGETGERKGRLGGLAACRAHHGSEMLPQQH